MSRHWLVNCQLRALVWHLECTVIAFSLYQWHNSFTLMLLVAPAAPLPHWPLWRTFVFRFCCLYILLYTLPWLLGLLPLGFVQDWYEQLENGLVNVANARLFHLKEQLVPLNGSGDTSYGFAQLCFYTLAALVGATVWSVFDKRRHYTQAYYWLLVMLRYYVAMIALSYGTAKVFLHQMVFPSLSALATPLGDLLPMRFSWYFIGYSAPYQFFSGAAEVVAGLLLLFRRTSTLGAFIAAGVFLNVMMMNLCYDIPVKLFSTHLFGMSLFLLLGDATRLFNFFVLNRPTQPTPPYEFRKPWMNRVRWGLKGLVFLLLVILPFVTGWQRMTKEAAEEANLKKLTTGVFKIDSFQAPTLPDSLRWTDMIFEATNAGSIATTDTLFRQRYRRGYFSYTLDSANREITLRKAAFDTTTLFRLRYQMPDTNHIQLWGRIRTDSVRVLLVRQNRHFQLAERQFHWLSEANR
jgi:hypothetical protein